MEATDVQPVEGEILEEEAAGISTENFENEECQENQNSFSSEVHENGNLKKTCKFELFYFSCEIQVF